MMERTWGVVVVRVVVMGSGMRGEPGAVPEDVRGVGSEGW